MYEKENVNNESLHLTLKENIQIFGVKNEFYMRIEFRHISKIFENMSLNYPNTFENKNIILIFIIPPFGIFFTAVF